MQKTQRNISLLMIIMSFMIKGSCLNKFFTNKVSCDNSKHPYIENRGELLTNFSAILNKQYNKIIESHIDYELVSGTALSQYSSNVGVSLGVDDFDNSFKKIILPRTRYLPDHITRRTDFTYNNSGLAQLPNFFILKFVLWQHVDAINKYGPANTTVIAQFFAAKDSNFLKDADNLEFTKHHVGLLVKALDKEQEEAGHEILIDSPETLFRLSPWLATHFNLIHHLKQTK